VELEGIHSVRPKNKPFLAVKHFGSENYKDIYGHSRDVNVVLYLRADFQHKFRFNLILLLVCYVEGSLKNGSVLTYIQAL
jgi:hypothetical protein